MDGLMLYSKRPGGYRQGGVHFDSSPRAISVVEERPNESSDEALDRRRRGEWTGDEIKGVRRVIADAKAAGVEPALVLVDGVSEAAAVDRQLSEKRAQLNVIIRQVNDFAVDAANARAEVEAGKRQIVETVRELAEENDKLEAAKRQLKDIETKIGKVRDMGHQIKSLEAEITRLKAAAEK